MINTAANLMIVQKTIVLYWNLLVSFVNQHLNAMYPKITFSNFMIAQLKPEDKFSITLYHNVH